MVTVVPHLHTSALRNDIERYAEHGPNRDPQQR